MKKENTEHLEKWQSMAVLIDYLGVSRESILQWIENKNMPAHKVGRQWKFKISEVDAWIRSGDAAEKIISEENDNE